MEDGVDLVSVVYEISAKQEHESAEDAITRVHGVGFFDESVDQWEAPDDSGEWQTGWLERVVSDLLEVHEWSREDDDHGTTLWADDYAWQIEVFAGSASLRYRNQWTDEPGSPLDEHVLETFAQAGAVLLTPDLEQYWDLADDTSPRELS